MCRVFKFGFKGGTISVLTATAGKKIRKLHIQFASRHSVRFKICFYSCRCKNGYAGNGTVCYGSILEVKERFELRLAQNNDPYYQFN